MADAIAAMKDAFAALSHGDTIVPARTHMRIAKHDGLSLIMPSYVGGDNEALAVKVASVFEQNQDHGIARIQAAVTVLDPNTGRPLALLEGATLTGIRTAAGSAAATDFLARSNAKSLAILGAGTQGRAHLEAICTVRQIESVRVFSRTKSKVEQLIADMAGQGPIPDNIRGVNSAAEAIQDADIICCATSSTTPIFDNDSIQSGMHINTVRSYTPDQCEVPAETVVRSRVFVDSREAAWEESGDLIQPLRAGLITEDSIVAELGELVTQQIRGRETDDEITLFKSVGVAVQDAVAATLALKNAESMGIGQRMDWD